MVGKIIRELSPSRILDLFLHQRFEVHAFIETIRFRAGIADETFLVEGFCSGHGLLPIHAQETSGHLLEFDGG